GRAVGERPFGRRKTKPLPGPAQTPPSSQTRFSLTSALALVTSCGRPAPVASTARPPAVSMERGYLGPRAGSNYPQVAELTLGPEELTISALSGHSKGS